MAETELGKSTLLKTLAGIYYPEKGKVMVDGSLIPFIELGGGTGILCKDAQEAMK